MVPDIAASAIANAIERSKACPLFAQPDPASLGRNVRNKQGSGSVSSSNSFATIVAGSAAWHRIKMESGYEAADAYRCAQLFRLGRSGRIGRLNRLTRYCATRYTERPIAIGGRRHVARRVSNAHASPEPSAEPRSNDRRFLHRGDDGDVLQCCHRAEHERLWSEERGA